MCAAAGWCLGDGGAEIAGDRAESVANRRGDAVHGGDRSERDQGRDEGVLDEVLSGFVVKQILENFHLSFLHFDYPSRANAGGMNSEKSIAGMGGALIPRFCRSFQNPHRKKMRGFAR